MKQIPLPRQAPTVSVKSDCNIGVNIGLNYIFQI